MNSTKKLASAIMSALLCVQVLLAGAAITATLVKDRSQTSHPSYLTALASENVALR